MIIQYLQPRPRWRGFSFALHLLRVQGFYFTRRRISHAQAFTAAFLSSMQFYTATTLKASTRLYRCVPVDLLHSSEHNTADIQAAYAPPPPRRTLYRAAQPSYYNKVYKGAAVRTYYRSMPDSAADRRPCQPGGVSMLPTVQGRSAWHTPPGGAVQQQGRGAAGGTIDGYRRISFRAFAR